MDTPRNGFSAISHYVNNLAPWKGIAGIAALSAALVFLASALGN
jgi:hypothetical protein